MIIDTRSEFKRRKLAEFIDRATEHGWTITIDKVRQPRTLSQLRYYWALLALYGCEIGYTADELHVDMKREYGLIYEKNGRKYLRSTSDLNTKEMTGYIDYIRSHAGRNGVYLPTADEMQKNWMEIQDYVDQQRRDT